MADSIISNENEKSQRQRLALEASWQIEGLTSMVLAGLQEIEDESGPGLKGAVVRIRQLSQIVMGALHDDIEKVEDLHRELHGSNLVRGAA